VQVSTAFAFTPVSLGQVPHRRHQNPEAKQYSDSERCPDQQACVHFVPPSLRAPRSGPPGQSYATETAIRQPCKIVGLPALQRGNTPTMHPASGLSPNGRRTANCPLRVAVERVQSWDGWRRASFSVRSSPPSWPEKGERASLFFFDFRASARVRAMTRPLTTKVFIEGARPSFRMPT
jgi:hypothetical protein